MKSKILLFVLLGGLLSSCRITKESLNPVNTYNIDIATNSNSKFVFVGTIGIANRPNVLYLDMLTAAKTKYGENVTISNIRFQKIGGFLIRPAQNVMFDVYKADTK
jgi:hypothetical protein